MTGVGFTVVRTIYEVVGIEEGEAVIRESKAALQTSFFISESGKLLLTNKRLVFVPNRLFAFYGAKPVIVSLADIEAADKKVGDTENLLAGSLGERLSIWSKGEEYIFLVRELGGWVQAVRDEI